MSNMHVCAVNKRTPAFLALSGNHITSSPYGGDFVVVPRRCRTRLIMLLMKTARIWPAELQTMQQDIFKIVRGLICRSVRGKEYPTLQETKIAHKYSESAADFLEKWTTMTAD